MDVIGVDLVDDHANLRAVGGGSLDAQDALQGVNVLVVVLQSNPSATVLCMAADMRLAVIDSRPWPNKKAADWMVISGKDTDIRHITIGIA